MSDLVLFDTSVLVDHLRTGRHRQRMASVTGLIRTSSVVLSELWRGVTTVAERKVVEALERSHPILTPTQNDWLESGRILGKIYSDTGFAPNKLRDLHFVVLIALTARSHGARLITSNRADFELIHRYRKFHLEIW
jgi:predicted nucleic acid-binding protein